MKYKKLRDISSVVMGQSPDSSTYNELKEGVPFFQGKSDFGQIHPTVRIYCSKPTKLAEPFDILMSVRAPVGDVNIANVECCIGRGLCAIRSNKHFNYKFLYYYLKTKNEELNSMATGSTFKAINKSILENINVPNFELEIQDKIVQVLDKAKELIDKRKAQIEALDELVKSRFIEMFGYPIINQKKWEENNLQKCCTKITDGTHDTPQRLSEGKLLITGKNIRQDKIDLTDIEFVSEEDHQIIYNRCNPEYGDVLYTNIGANYGTAVINNLSYEFSMKNVALLKPNKDKITGVYLWHYLNICRAYIVESNKSAGAQTFMSLATIKKIRIMIPPIELQNQFADFVEQVEKIKAEMQESLKELEDNFNSLMQKAFKGELFN